MLNRQNGNFTVILNTVVNDQNLSAKAKGIYIYLQSKKDGWQFYESEIIKHFKDGIRSIRGGIKELIDNGYLLKYQERGTTAGFAPAVWILNPTDEDYEIYEGSDSVVIKPVVTKRVNREQHTNNTNNNNTDFNKTNSTRKRENFNKFKKDFVNRLYKEGKQFNTFESGFLETTFFSINAAGFIVNDLTGKSVDVDDAYKIWGELYKRFSK